MITEKYAKLIETIIEKTTDKEELMDLLQFVDTSIEYMDEYVQAVNEHVRTVKRSSVLRKKGIISAEEYKFRVEMVDSNRRTKHNAMLSAMNQLNRLCDRFGVEKFCPENQDRHVRATFAGAVTTECFLEGIHASPKVIEELCDKMYPNDEEFSGNGRVD